MFKDAFDNILLFAPAVERFVCPVLHSDVNVSYVPESEERLAAVGDSIAYNFDIVNAGSVTLSSIDLLVPQVRSEFCLVDRIALSSRGSRHKCVCLSTERFVSAALVATLIFIRIFRG